MAISTRRSQSHTHVMDHLTRAESAVPRGLFLDGHAECRTCRAHVRPTPQTRAYVREAATPTAVAWCSVCCATNEYRLDPGPPLTSG